MATTTTLTAFEPGNSTGSLHVQFSLYSSTPDSGAVGAGMGDWYVVRGGSVIHRWRGMIGGWATATTGDIVYVKYTDGAGVSGAFASYTFTLDATWDGSLYVDTSWGGTESGTESEPYATWDAAYDAYVAARGSAEKWRILLKRGETFDNTGMASTNWVTLGSTTGHLQVGPYGSGAKPAITIATSGNGSIMAGGQLGAMTLTLDSLAVTGAGSGTGSEFCNFLGAPITASTEANICVLDCDVVGCEAIYIGPYSGAASGDWADEVGRVDFHALVGCTFDDWGSGSGGHAFTNISSVAYMLLFDCTWLEQIAANGFIRFNAPRDTATINCTFDRSASTFKSNVFRCGGGEDTDPDDSCLRFLVSGCSFLDCAEAIEMEVTGHPWDASYDDCDFIDNYFTQNAGVNYPISFGGADDNASHRLTNIRIIGNQSCSDWLPLIGINVGGAVTDTGHVESMLIANNTSVVRGGGGLGVLLNVGGSSTARVDAGAFTIYGNLGVATSNGGMFLSDGGGAITASKIAAANYNHYVCNGGGTPSWTSGVTLATWDDGGLDVNSTSSNSGTHNLTDVTYAGFDARPASGTGPQIGTGGGTVYIDADGNLFVDDAGAFEYGGSAPDSPTASGSPYSLAADTGTFALTGNAASLLAARLMEAEAGSYAFTGNSATLTYSGASASTTPRNTGLTLGLRLGL